ncbi:hypothetical protein H634G_10640 [Metarhizium anisopliae BRIP 53293]|uniref:Uncharacterized protein n=1 Tax=Metarhizium anisopliae BRIP 53293 TaxID=1291518 RepID=A0A0D9NJQ9_METAN|nr:hypothetical protein H634G_10640 [Metarhizium anisopliae BRIP 53293]KJK87032.1 hypothetical protein H633G_09103 [Metarhizium anisopliae BRIP 53284]
MALRFLHPPRFLPLGDHGANTLQRHDALPTQVGEKPSIPADLFVQMPASRV